MSAANTPSNAPEIAPRAAPATRSRRWLPHRPRSLRGQMAVGSALVALAAVILVTLAALITVAISFDHYQRSLLAAEASQLATAYGNGQTPPFSPASSFANRSGGTDAERAALRVRSGTTVWVMDQGGGLFVSPTANIRDPTALAQDKAIVAPALQKALHGQATQGELSGAHFPFLVSRLYYAVPVHAGGQDSGAVIGALAVSTPLRSPTAGVFKFLGDVNTSVLLAALAAVCLAVVAAALFSRRLARPLLQLGDATASMAGGDYATRVAIPAPTEFTLLAASFNEMAAALERDVGELRYQEQLRRELVANVSHELATPLTAIEGFTEALLDDVVRDPASRVETVRTIAREAARLHRLVDQLRQVALYEAGAITLERAPLALDALVAQTVDVLAPELEQKRITLQNTVGADLPRVYADGDRVTEILLNLLDNALHHTPLSGIIEVSAAAEGDMVRIAVADSGPGVAPEQRERIFERFYRADLSRSNATGGGGLGLAIVRALVEAHGGTIEAGERAGGGARFSFTLPRADITGPAMRVDVTAPGK
ncbi:MAG TPA: HAMP domain-containing sensor histidine kinase [Ktedonobacterales bacterium]|nr:HAMP domain-containing sensor histidine kinase [Ktedonobacterales bacterium]